ncbi:HAD-IA family hydrolase [Herbaspirillum sp. RV1423]|uniref:HAD-IA family hydrolase n=1 Tax=Herbaspirillum sp. RV1423 TaxID=1443993 RepID=UPI00055334B0|nr:HAD-IA family hydrolase [Herbaspirillum sp. RV1423]
MKPAITHLVCDCDGVLLDSESIALRVLHEHLSPLLRSPDEGDRLHHAIASRLGMFTELLLDELDLEFGFGLNAGQYAGINLAVGIACGEEVQLVPGIADALLQIDLPKAVASNSSSDRIVKGLERCGLLAMFDGHIHSAHEVGRPKPAPHVYLAAAAGYGIAPQHCVAVDDSVTGVRAASTAGMRVLGFTGVAHDRQGMHHRLLDAGAERVFDDMRELPALIGALLAERAA